MICITTCQHTNLVPDCLEDRRFQSVSDVLPYLSIHEYTSETLLRLLQTMVSSSTILTTSFTKEGGRLEFSIAIAYYTKNISLSLVERISQGVVRGKQSIVMPDSLVQSEPSKVTMVLCSSTVCLYAARPGHPILTPVKLSSQT
ncbi:hypothetical protein AVEN_109621-1 [Araneus ventricosus]|uniref:Uncharacterized protein n=1 Tax=Araneus ventricosus TaxID=182803 RepID=A0A4Y2SMU9_ARAVE|nr:hypothetical protein AVEN_44595-1 [Araneus ventricosus]GBN79062.1 hypothetical protein AVEN_90721-1 [Araneus ventricosus]GBN89624.1 hypothetical protein AVEN_186266-1 [Araneus ventricosus]GBN89680.1 hypothetical protein AVEN_109621-1 [Araneus ventricosus]